MKTVKLKSLDELKKLGYRIDTINTLPGHIDLCKEYQGGSEICATLDLKRSQELFVAPMNSINEEIYEHFKSAFEVIDDGKKS